MQTSIVECHFFLPLTRDALLSDGQSHPTGVWEKLDEELFVRFSGRTIAPEKYRGFYRDPDTGARIDDESYKFIVAVPVAEVELLRDLIRDCCEWFEQKCIYLAIAGSVEFINRRGLP